jgi:hypothetical protein
MGLQAWASNVNSSTMTITIKDTDPELARAAELSWRGEEVLAAEGRPHFQSRAVPEGASHPPTRLLRR